MVNIWIVIPVHNGKKLTQLCLESLRKQDYQGFNVLVFDDGSNDGTATMIAREFPEVVLLRGDGNYWWSRSMNEGIRYALDKGADHIISLNNDVELAEDSIGSLMAGIEKYPGALQGSLAYDKKTKTLVYDGLIMNWRKAKLERISDLYEGESLPDFMEVSHLPGRGTLIPAKVFNDIGFFDAENFPQYAADFDFCLRAAKAGYTVGVNTKAILYSLSEDSAMRFKNPYSLKNLFGYLTSIKSTASVRILPKYYLRHCPKRYLPYNLVKSYLLSIGRYVLRWLQSKWNTSL